MTQPMRPLSFKSASKTTKIVAMGLLLAAVGAAAACSASVDDNDVSEQAQTPSESLPYTIRECPGRACK